MTDERPMPGDTTEALAEQLAILVQQFARSRTRLYFYTGEHDLLQPLTTTSAAFAARRAGGTPSGSGLWWQKLRRLIGTARFDWAIDVGVNYGYTTAWFATRAARVIAIEPAPANQALIREQIAIRHLANVELIAAAAGDRAGMTRLHLKPFDGHHSLGNIGASKTIAVLDVPVVTLDALASERGIDRVGLLKIDVEGFEDEVLEGARDLLTAHRIDRVVFEFSPAFYRQRGLSETGPADRLVALGYRLFDLDGRPVDAATIAQQMPQTDLLALAPGIAEPRA